VSRGTTVLEKLQGEVERLVYSGDETGYTVCRLGPVLAGRLVDQFGENTRYHLLGAVPRQASLLLVGDVDQLPSVGPGNVLRDILDSGAVPAVTLTDIFRQGERSQIVEQAHRINQGLMPRGSRKPGTDFFVITTDEPEKASDLVVQLCLERIPERFGLDPMRDIQVLCPMNRGSIGASALNRRLQEVLNPDGTAVTRFGRTFRSGDRVLQTANNAG